MNLLDVVPRAPTWSVDYGAIERAFDWCRALRDCPQDKKHHAEGDVGLHTEMVLSSLCALAEFRALSDEDRAVVFLACLLHDVAKPATTKTEDDGRITAKGHSSKGAVMARTILWEMNVPWRVRERVCGLIRFHQLPFFLVEKDEREAERRLLTLAESCNARHLALVAEADMRGRVCADQQQILDAIELFRVAAEEAGVSRSSYAFSSAHARFRYFRDDRRTRYDDAFDDTRCTVTLLSGLPATGKSTWMAKNVDDAGAIVSLDDLREEHGIEHGDSQRAVIELAREKMKERLRRSQDVVWNATSLSRSLRSQVIDIADAYNARVRVVCCESSCAVVHERNRARERPVPAAAIARMLTRWEFPDGTEAHAVDVSES